MSAGAVRLLTTGQTGDISGTGEKYQSTYQVDVTDPLDGAVVAIAANGIPRLGASYQFDPNALVTSYKPQRDSKTRLMWTVQVIFETPAKQKDSPQGHSASDNPFDWRDQCNYEPINFQTPVQLATLRTAIPSWNYSVGDIIPIMNAAGELIIPVPEKDDSRAVIKIKKIMTEFPATYDRDLRHKTNRSEYSVVKPTFSQTFDPGTVKWEPMGWALKYHIKKDGQEIVYCEVTVTLNIKWDGWRSHIPNLGFNRFFGPGAPDWKSNYVFDGTITHLKRLVDKDHKPVGPLVLDKFGLDPGDKIKERQNAIDYDFYDGADFPSVDHDNMIG